MQNTIDTTYCTSEEWLHVYLRISVSQALMRPTGFSTSQTSSSEFQNLTGEEKPFLLLSRPGTATHVEVIDA